MIKGETVENPKNLGCTVPAIQHEAITLIAWKARRTVSSLLREMVSKYLEEKGLITIAAMKVPNAIDSIDDDLLTKNRRELTDQSEAPEKNETELTDSNKSEESR